MRRKDALAKGLTKYIPNKPCKRGHFLRLASGQCFECIQEDNLQKVCEREQADRDYEEYQQKRAKLISAWEQSPQIMIKDIHDIMKKDLDNDSYNKDNAKYYNTERQSIIRKAYSEVNNLSEQTIIEWNRLFRLQFRLSL